MPESDANSDDNYTTVKHNAEKLLYACQWKLQMSEMSNMLTQEAKVTVSPYGADFMNPDDLHCMSQVSLSWDGSVKNHTDLLTILVDLQMFSSCSRSV